MSRPKKFYGAVNEIETLSDADSDKDQESASTDASLFHTSSSNLSSSSFGERRPLLLSRTNYEARLLGAKGRLSFPGHRTGSVDSIRTLIEDDDPKACQRTELGKSLINMHVGFFFAFLG